MPDFASTQQFITQWNQTGADIALATLLCIGAAIDVRTHRLPNWLTVGGAVLGLLWSLMPAGVDVTAALGGAALGLVALLPLYMLRVMGAGDVKLMAMVGAFAGAPQVLAPVLFSFIAGGVFALGFAARRRATGQVLKNAREAVLMNAFAMAAGQRVDFTATPSIGKFPYGLAICAGTLTWIAAVHFI